MPLVHVSAENPFGQEELTYGTFGRNPVESGSNDLSFLLLLTEIPFRQAGDASRAEGQIPPVFRNPAP